MNAKPTFVLLTDGASCQVLIATGDAARTIDVATPPDPTPRQLTTATLEALRANGYEGEGVVLAMPSQLCFAATIAVDDLPKNDAHALLFRLEEKLPLAAETIVADFVDDGATALGICVKTECVAPLIEAMTAVGIDVQTIAPAAMLAAQGVSADQDITLLLPEPAAPTAQLNLIAVRDGRPVRWANLPCNSADLATHTKLLAGDVPMPLAAIADAPREMADSLDAHLLTISTADAIAHIASQITAGRARAWFNFRRGALGARDRLQRHRRPLNALLAAAAIFFFALTLACLIRAQRYRQLQTRADDAIRREFLAQFPNWSGPINLAIIESEHRKFAAAAGESTPIAAGSALKTLADVCSHLPPQSGFTVSRMSFGENSFELEGRVSSYENIDALVAAARSAGLNVPPPQARKDGDNTWSFVLRGARTTEASIATETAQSP